MLLSGCEQKTGNTLPGNETKGEFTYRMTLADMRMAEVPIKRSAKGRMVIKSVSEKQRPRRVSRV